ncbi:helix-turn-helix transcriptional regulator [Candidatus Nomurabacteria bacterium]|nr:helix-turn-helix transcriptional regulator [Candidatus Nomurabacteria bacterium]
MLQLNNPKDVQLSEKEITVLKLICDDKDTKEIASILDLSPRTIEKRRDDLRSKTGAKGYPGLVRFAINSGIVKV